MCFGAVHEDGGLVIFSAAFEVKVVDDVIGCVRILIAEGVKECLTVGDDLLRFDG